jgi:hypothetical protein
MYTSLKMAVIASEAKQFRESGSLSVSRDCFVAALLAMTRCMYRVTRQGRILFLSCFFFSSPAYTQFLSFFSSVFFSCSSFFLALLHTSSKYRSSDSVHHGLRPIYIFPLPFQSPFCGGRIHNILNICNLIRQFYMAGFK